MYSEKLIRRVIVFVSGREREEDGVQVHMSFEQLRDRYRPSHANDQWANAIDLVERLARRAQREVFRADGVGTRAVILRRHRQGRARRNARLEMADHERDDLGWILIGNKPTR